MAEEHELRQEFDSLIAETFPNDAAQMLAVHTFFEDAQSAGFSEEQAMTLTAKMLAETWRVSQEMEGEE